MHSRGTDRVLLSGCAVEVGQRGWPEQWLSPVTMAKSWVSPMSHGLKDYLRVTNLCNGTGRGKLLGCPRWRQQFRITLHRSAGGSRPLGLQGIKPNPDGNSGRRDTFYHTRPEGHSQMRTKKMAGPTLNSSHLCVFQRNQVTKKLMLFLY